MRCIRKMWILQYLTGGPRVLIDRLAELDRLVTNWEIRDAVFAIRQDKSSGPDGYTSCFFKKSWNIIGQDVCAAVHQFFDFGCLLK